MSYRRRIVPGRGVLENKRGFPVDRMMTRRIIFRVR
jgi:hypothetical protein